MRKLNFIGIVFITVLACAPSSKNGNSPIDRNVSVEQEIASIPFEDNTFISRDLYIDKSYAIQKRVLEENTVFDLYFEGNIDFLGTKKLDLIIRSIGDSDTLHQQINIATLEQHSYFQRTHFEKWAKDEYGGKIGQFLVEKSGVYRFEFTLIAGEDIIRINKAKVTMLSSSR
jgi:hypothetical protein